MRFRFIRLLVPCLIACMLLVAQGCEDADATTRLNVANAIKKAADDAFLAGSDSASLGKVERDLKAIKGGSDKQMATRDRLLASIQMHLAALDMADIEKMEIGLRHDLVRLRAMGFASERLAAFSSAREKVSGPINTPQLNERREQIRSQAELLRNQASQIEAPVVNSVETLEKSNEEVLRLQRQANELRDEAAMADPVNRFPIMERAIELERQADRIEAEMMRQELSLELVQQPAKEMMDRSRSDLEEMLAEIDAAQDDLQTISPGRWLTQEEPRDESRLERWMPRSPSSAGTSPTASPTNSNRPTRKPNPPFNPRPPMPSRVDASPMGDWPSSRRHGSSPRSSLNRQIWD